ncbi:MAG TPA: nuclear transport factor 2 family protein [Gemmatimonadaceae bacterium]|nr:nuclear transport factor 2 family protein [Gemmatimonadaceae bacterium]
MREKRTIVLAAVSSVFLFACYKSTPASADSATASSTASGASLDRNAARAEILGNDSTFIRGMMAKNVDTVMCCYDNDAVSIGTGKTLKGVSDLRKAYTEAVKSNARDVTFNSDGVNFSNDGSMAWDYGTFSQTVDVKGKPTKQSGNFLNVWKRVDGKWKIAAEISTPSQ